MVPLYSLCFLLCRHSFLSILFKHYLLLSIFGPTIFLYSAIPWLRIHIQYTMIPTCTAVSKELHLVTKLNAFEEFFGWTPPKKLFEKTLFLFAHLKCANRNITCLFFLFFNILNLKRPYFGRTSWEPAHHSLQI